MKWKRANEPIVKEISEKTGMPKKQVWLILVFFFKGLRKFLNGKNWIFIHGYFKLRMKYYYYKRYLFRNKNKANYVDKNNNKD